MLADKKKQLNKAGEIYLRIKARPGAVRNLFTEIMEDETIKIDIAAAPEKGKANRELIKFLAKEFAVLKNNIKIVSGQSEKIKLIKIKK